MKNRYKANNILIIIFLFLFIILGLIGTFAYQQPTNLKEATGIIQDYKQHEGKWYDNIFGNSKGSYFKVKFEDDSFFESTGICYDNIDKTLFEKIKIGDCITIIYNEESGRPDRIYAIKYNGKDYLLLEDSLNGFKQTERIMHIFGPSISVLSIVVGLILFAINYKKNK